MCFSNQVKPDNLQTDQVPFTLCIHKIHKIAYKNAYPQFSLFPAWTKMNGLPPV